MKSRSSSGTYSDLHPAKQRASSRPNATRKGCWTCKRYHRKCDEREPFCRRCSEEYGIECEGYGPRRVAFRIGFSANPNIASSPAPAAVVRTPAPSMQLRGPTTSPGALFSPYELRLLEVFRGEFATLAAISPHQDVYSQDIAPLVAKRSDVRAAVLALSAAYTARDHMASAFAYYDNAVKVIRSVRLTTWQDKQAHLAGIFLMAWFDIIVFDPEKWNVHLNMACSLINDTADQLWATSSGRRILHSIARLDCSNALSNRGAPMLSASTYTILKASSYDRDSDNIDVLVDGECMRLHGILGAAAVVSFDWTTGTQPPPESVYNDATEVLRQLKSWYEDVPEPLRWKEGFDATDQRITLEWLSDKSRLFQMLWLHYFAITVHVYHILDPVRSGLWNESVAMAKHCLVLVKNLDLQDGLDNRLYRGDMSPLFVLAVIGVLIEDPEDQLWIHEYLLRQGRDTLWCGYERAACLQAWWRSKGAGKQLIMSQPDRAGTLWGWKPDMGMRVKILYEDLETGKLEFDSHYFPDFRPPRLPT